MRENRFVVAFTTAFACVVCGAFAAPVRIDVNVGDSLVAVRDRVRMLPPSEKANGVEIVLAEGEYLLDDGLDLTVADGGASIAAPVVWRSEKPGAARIVGSRRIPASSFKKVEDPALLARIPEEGHGKVYAADVSAFCPDAIADLPDSFLGAPPPPFVFFDGNLGSMARWPNGGEWAAFTNRVDKGLRGGGAFVFDDSRVLRWDFAKGVWLNGYFTHDWDNRCVRALSYGEENGTNCVLRLRGDTKFGVMAGTWGRRERRFRVFNVLEELDEEGEWYLDRERKVLFVVPLGGVMKEDTDIRIALSEKPLLSGRGVKNLKFDGIGFCCAYGGFARLEDLEDVTFSGCLFSGAAKDGIKVERGTRVRFDGCEIVHCGEGCLGFQSCGSRKDLKRSDSSVENCRIHDYAMLKRTYACAVELKDVCGFAVRGNEIWDAPHMAMRYESNDTLIESNDIYHVVMETGDAGALYSGRDWTTQGNILRYNFIHDLGPGTTSREGEDAAVSGTNAMGIYFDDCDCGDEVYGNVFLNVPRGIMIGGGRDHPVRNNVFINCNLGLSIDCRGIRWKHWNKPGDGWHLEGKAQKFDYTEGLWAERYPRLASIMNDHPREPLYNPVEGNTFIDCGAIIDVREMFTYNDNGTAPGIFSRMAPMRDNTVIYTKCANVVKRQMLDPRIASGFRVLDSVKE